MIKKCTLCQKEFESKRSTAKFCSNLCKMRVKNADSVSISVSDKDSVSDDLITQAAELGISKKCAGCGVEINPLVCICADCIKAGKTHESLGLTCHQNNVAPMIDTQQEYQKSNSVLEANTVEELKKKDIWLPNWKRTLG